MNQQQFMELLRKGRYKEAFDFAYKGFRAVKKYITENSGTEDDARDMFQEALMVLCQKTENPEFELTASVHTYIYAVCKNLWREQLRMKNKYIFLDDGEDHKEMADASVDIEEVRAREAEWQAAERVLKTLGDKCREILVMYYSQSSSMSAIAEKLGLKSENAAKTQKYKCLEQARHQLLNLIHIA